MALALLTHCTGTEGREHQTKHAISWGKKMLTLLVLLGHICLAFLGLVE